LIINHYFFKVARRFLTMMITSNNIFCKIDKKEKNVKIIFNFL
jgi:hypothetical protein